MRRSVFISIAIALFAAQAAAAADFGASSFRAGGEVGLSVSNVIEFFRAGLERRAAAPSSEKSLPAADAAPEDCEADPKGEREKAAANKQGPRGPEPVYLAF